MSAWYTPLIDFAKNIGTSLVDNAGSAALGGIGLLAANQAYQRLGDIGEQAIAGVQVRDPVTGQMITVPGAYGLAQMGLEQTAFKPFTVTSSTGSQFGVTPTATGGLAAAFGLSPEEAALQQSLMSGAQNMFTAAQGDRAQREADIYSAIRAVQTPEEERQRMALEERLAAQGRLGVQTAQYGGTPEQLAMAQAQAEAQNRASVAAIEQARAEQLQQAQLGQQFMTGSYMPQSQMMNVLQASQLFPQLQQRGQLYGAGLFGEAGMGGLQALLGAAQGQANLMGTIGTGLMSGAVSR